ncbi:hypothetical protein MBRA1_003428 [Malassezia brasiliensis]|uniref:Copper-fist domain-containing protein n=1 Tax=Malassezia brasiliensis TaxID=1821822 RepID=A0AAF0IR39_9BASI|nr:hypothetical protein MBRA1_003428 [Malassezia brasiliensis]
MPTPEPPPPTEPPVKLACATCIQGHRASTCKHQDGSKGPLLVVKRRGRPLSQCQACREKRFKTGRHTRCICDAKPRTQRSHTTTTNNASNTAPASKSPKDVPDSSARSSSSPLSFANLLNPCRCKRTGICTCCDTFYSLCAKDECGTACNSCGPSAGCQKPIAPTLARKPPLPPIAPKPEVKTEQTLPARVTLPPLQLPPTASASGSCCARREAEDETPMPNKRRREDTMSLLAQAADMSRPYVPPWCLKHTQGRPYNAAHAERPSERMRDCNSCVACDIQLRNPSGIPSVDRWITSESMRHGSVATTMPSPYLSLSRPV